MVNLIWFADDKFWNFHSKATKMCKAITFMCLSKTMH